jgi:hypothetical protein
MKTLFIYAVSFAWAVWCAQAESNLETSAQTVLLNDALKGLYQDVVSGVAETNIVGRAIDAHLSLLMCSDKHLLFEDTRIVVDKDTNYYFVEWKFNEAQVATARGGRLGLRCHVKGRIIEVRRGETTPGMPYVVAQLQQIGADDPQSVPTNSPNSKK